MNIDRESVIRMAREAGFDFNSLGGTYTSGKLNEYLELFASIVEKEVKREAGFDRAELWLGRINRAIQEEREACAKVCESLFDMDDDSCNEAEQCAAAIRARGETSSRGQA